MPVAMVNLKTGECWMGNPITKIAGAVAAFVSYAIAGAGAAWAAQPTPWQKWHQPAASPNMEEIIWFDWYTLAFIVPITLLVMALLAYVMMRFNARSNPEPSKTTHNTTIEIIWTLGPVLILVALAIPSFKLLTNQVTPPQEPALTIKATGYQWYWGYEYQDTDAEISFEARPIGSEVVAGSKEAALKERQDLGKTDLAEYPNLLAVDNELVVPVGKTVRVLVTAGDVIHDFALPAFGLKMDGIPGRMNETHFTALKEGLYYGQCSELCGKLHAYMPIAIRVVSQDDFATWVDMAGDDVGAANKALMATLNDRKKTIDVASKAVVKTSN